MGFSGKEFTKELRGVGGSQQHTETITNNQLKVFTAGEPSLKEKKIQTANLRPILSLSMKSFGLFLHKNTEKRAGHIFRYKPWLFFHLTETIQFHTDLSKKRKYI